MATLIMVDTLFAIRCRDRVQAKPTAVYQLVSLASGLAGIGLGCSLVQQHRVAGVSPTTAPGLARPPIGAGLSGEDHCSGCACAIA